MSLRPDCFSEEHLQAYAAGTLPPDETRRVGTHLEGCIWCQATVDWYVQNPGQKRAPLEPGPADRSDAPTGTYHAPLDATESEPSEVIKPPRQLNGYEIVRVLGDGGYGIVYEAIDTVLNRSVAIKVLKRDFANQAISRRRFIREARAGAAINHPNVVTIYGVDEAGEMPFLIMELVNGETLRERIHRQPKLDILDVLRISAQTAQGLAAAHAQGIIHRDVKPGNIMLVDSMPRVKITDFGLARVQVENFELTSSQGLAVGTPAYMSPEQVRGEDLDARSDLFALGCVMYAMLAGHSPFHGRTALDIARRIDSFEPPRLTESHKHVPEFLEQIITRLLRKDPELRYQSAAEVADVLNRHLAMLNQTPSDRLPVALRSPLLEDTRRSPRVAAWTMASLGVLGMAVLGWSVWGPKDAGGPPVVVAPANLAVPPVLVPQPDRPLPADLKPLVTVAKSLPADCTSILEALRRVAPQGRITILDDGEYNEAIEVDNARQFTGVTLSAPRHATLRSDAGDAAAVLAVRGVPQFRVEGLKIIAPQSQYAIEVTGHCPGLVLEDLEIERSSNERKRGRVAGIYFRYGASGTAEQPIVIRRVELRPTVVGIVVGNPERGTSHPAHIVIEECRVEGLDRDQATLLVLKRGTADVTVRRNLFSHALQGLSILADEQEMPQRCRVEHNTWHNIETWVTWNGPADIAFPVSVEHNLVLDSGRIGPALKQLPQTAATFVNNLHWNAAGRDGEEMAPFAVRTADFPILSWDERHPDYLKPDFTKLDSALTADAPLPGRYSENR